MVTILISTEVNEMDELGIRPGRAYYFSAGVNGKNVVYIRITVWRRLCDEKWYAIIYSISY